MERCLGVRFGRRSSRVLLGTAIVGSMALSAGSAWAQSSPATTSSMPVETVVVTGSLIASPNHTSSSPIVATSIADIKASGAPTLEASLNQLPQFQPAGTSGNGGQGTGGHATLNLRGLGSNRNLVLLNGRRLPMADINGDVDINFIPESIISGVEAITGGASAVYGSDAMSGVVNFKTLRNYEGLRAEFQYGNSFKSDYPTVTASLTGGTEFANGKGHFLVSASYSHRDPLSGSKRGFFAHVTPSSYLGQGTYVPSASNLPSNAVVGALFAGYGAASPVTNTDRLGFNDDGTLFQQNGAANYKGPTTGYWAVLGGNVRMPVGVQADQLSGLDRKAVFAKFDYALSSHVAAYGQALYVNSNTLTASGGSLTQFAVPTIPVTNPFIPADLATVLASRPNPTASFTWNARYWGVPYKSWDEHYYMAQYLGGLRGDLPFRDWSWDAFVSYGMTDHVQQNHNAVLAPRVQTLLDAADGGASICAGGFNPFGLANATHISQACKDYMTFTAHSTESLTLLDAQAQAQGSLFSLPAGDVQLAMLVDYMRNTYQYSPDSQLAAGNIEAVIASKPAHGAIGVSEFASQIDVPVLRDLPFAHKLDLSAAYRYSDYTTTGGVSTYEADVKWWPTNSVLFRGGFQRAIRAPNIGELYSAAAGGQVAFGTPPGGGEPCNSRLPRSAQLQALCIATGVPAGVIGSYSFPTTATATLTTGNPKLTPEKATTYNMGVVYTSNMDSPWLANFSASVDYWNIEIANVISVVPGTTALSKCYNQDGSNPTYSAANYFCSLISRDPATGDLVTIATPYENLGGLKTDGLDLQVDYTLNLADVGAIKGPGQIFVHSGIAYTANYSVETLPKAPFQNYIGTNTIGAPHPQWKALTTIGYDFGDATLAIRWHYMDAMKDISAVNNPAHVAPGVGAYNLFDLVGTYDFNSRWHFRAGITNLANRGLPIVSSSQISTDTSTYDAVGRAYYLGLRIDL